MKWCICLAMATCFAVVAEPGMSLAEPSNTAGPKSEMLDQLMEGFAEHRRFHGVVLAAEGDHVVYEQAFGYGNLEWGAPNTTDSAFRIASITKCFTAVLVMQQVEKGLLQLDGTVGEYLPDYDPTTGDRITIHHLLSHTAGLMDFPDVPEDFDIRERLYHDYAQLHAYFEGKDLAFHPGDRFKYSNFGYVLLAEILEAVTGESYGRLLQDGIFTPAGMTHTGIDDNETVLRRRAVGYHHEFLGEPVNSCPIDMSVVVGAGDLYSTAGDLYRFDRALYGDTLISPASLEVMSTPVQNPYMRNYGYGLDIRQREWGAGGDAVTVVGLAGSINGFRSNYCHVVEDDLCIVVLTNYKDRSGNTAEVASPPWIADQVAAILYGREPRLPAPSAAAVLARRVLHGEADSARKALQTSGRDHDELDWDADEFRDTALWFIGRDHPDHALDLMDLYCELESPSPLDHARLAGLAHHCDRSAEAEAAMLAALAGNQWGEALLNMIAYEFLQRQLYDDAVYLFSRNVTEFPESPNVYDSLGEAFMRAGDTERAIANYRQSLQLAPDNTNAEAMLEILMDDRTETDR